MPLWSGVHRRDMNVADAGHAMQSAAEPHRRKAAETGHQRPTQPTERSALGHQQARKNSGKNEFDRRQTTDTASSIMSEWPMTLQNRTCLCRKSRHHTHRRSAHSSALPRGRMRKPGTLTGGLTEGSPCAGAVVPVNPLARLIFCLLRGGGAWIIPSSSAMRGECVCWEAALCFCSGFGIFISRSAVDAGDFHPPKIDVFVRLGDKLCQQKQILKHLGATRV